MSVILRDIWGRIRPPRKRPTPTPTPPPPAPAPTPVAYGTGVYGSGPYGP